MKEKKLKEGGGPLLGHSFVSARREWPTILPLAIAGPWSIIMGGLKGEKLRVDFCQWGQPRVALGVDYAGVGGGGFVDPISREKREKND